MFTVGGVFVVNIDFRRFRGYTEISLGADFMFPHPSIPNFTHEGLLPPYVGGDAPCPARRSPYHTNLRDFFDRFGTSKERISILRGFLTLRQRLLNLGFQGTQWLGGSFLTQKKTPADIDIVTIANAYPPNVSRDILLKEEVLFPTCTNLLCDSYFVPLMPPEGHSIDLSVYQQEIAKEIFYWTGLFSHTRDKIWKGMLTIPLPDGSEDYSVHSDLLDQMEKAL